MSVETGKFDTLGASYETGTNAALLSAIARSAEELTSGKGWPDGVNDLLEALGRVTGVSRVWIFQTVNLTDTHITQNYTFEWASSPKYVQIGMPMFSMFTNPIDRPEYRDMIESRKRGGWQKVITANTEPGWLRNNQEIQSIKSMLTIPVMVEDQWWGTLGFDDCEREYDWTDVEIALLKTAGYLISNAVLRDRLSAKRKQFDILKRLTDSNAWAFDFKTGQVWCSTELVHSVPMPTENFRMSMLAALRWIHPEDRPQFLAAIRRYLKKTSGVFRYDVRLFSDCGDIRWMEFIGNISRNSQGVAEQFAGIAVDIRARKQEEERLLHEATTDPLTGVMNRRMFERTLQKQIDRSLDEESDYALLLLNLDCFKGLNDRYGRAVGDQVLRNFTSICSRTLRPHDVLARLGGDEFVLLLPDTDSDMARSIGERVRRSVVNTPYFFETSRVVFTTSVGLVAHDGELTTPARMIEKGNYALYNAKRSGRNCLVATSDACCMPASSSG